MNRRTALTALVIALSLSAAVHAQDTAAQWADKNKEALEAIHDASLADTLKQGTPALEALFATVKTDGDSDPVASVRIAALSQYVMRPAGAGSRKAYADALLAAAQRATDADVICFFLYQLRWCGLPQQAEAIKAFERSDKPGVSTLAAMTVQAVTDDRSSKAPPAQDTPCSALNKELATLKPKALTPRLIQVFDGPDAAQAGVALAWARTAGGKKETALWGAKLPAVSDPVRKAMLLDMLGGRGDPSACEAVAACLADADETVAMAARNALIKLDPAAFAAQLPLLLKTLPAERQALARDGIRQLKTALAQGPLTQSYDTFSDAGKKAALEVIKERRIAAAAEIGLKALAATDDETVIAGFRLLREIAGPGQAGAILAKTLASSGRVTPEGQNAFAAAARRDAGGAYAAALAQALATSPDAQKPVALETAARVGGEALLKAAEAAAGSANAEVATAAVRALADWSDATSLPALLRLAVGAPDAKRQTLALRGASKKLNADGADKKVLLPVWRELRAQPGNDANKRAIDDLFKEEVNVALGKPVTADVPQEGNNVPANLTDGTLEKAWHAAKTPAAAVVDLGAPQKVSAAHITFYHSDGRTYTFTLEGSEDGKTWQALGGNVDAPKPATAEGLHLTFPETTIRQARLTVVKNSANQAAHVLELKLLQNSAP